MNIQNASIEWDGKLTKYGAFKGVRVKAGNLEDAELAAVQLIRSDPDLKRLIKNPPEDPPMIYLDSWQPLSKFAHLKQSGGATWYQETDDNMG